MNDMPLSSHAQLAENAAGLAGEKRLLHDLKRAGAMTRGRWVVQVHLSRLRPHSRPDHALRSAESTFSGLTRQGGGFYWLRDSDFVVMCTRAQRDAVRSALVKIKFLFAGDPLIEGMTDPTSDTKLVTWYDLDADYDTVFAKAEALVKGQSGLTRTAGRHFRNHAARQERPGAQLTPGILAKIETALAGADLSTHIRRQAVCAVVGRSLPEPVFAEVFVSIANLRDALVPHIDLASDTWLFLRLTQTLDRRVLSMLTRKDDRTLEQGFSINLNVQTILSEDFLRFDDGLAPGTHGAVVLELRAEDVFADLGAYFFARDFVRQRGYRLCIDGLTWRTLPFVDPQRLGVDLVKLLWSDDLPDIIESDEGVLAREALQSTVSGRLILAHCDNQRAIAFGQKYGITLYQGRAIDQSIKPIGGF